MTEFKGGVDMSMTSPSVCLEKDGSYHIYYINANEKYIHSFSVGNVSVTGFHYDHANINGEKKKKLRESHTETQRFITLSMLFEQMIPDAVGDQTFAFEAYAFGAKGRLAQIGENTGILKAVLTSKGYNIHTISPTSIKKHAAGTGKAEKPDMADAFFEKFGFYPHLYIGCPKEASPASDIVDSYWVLDTAKNYVEPPKEVK